VNNLLQSELFQRKSELSKTIQYQNKRSYCGLDYKDSMTLFFSEIASTIISLDKTVTNEEGTIRWHNKTISGNYRVYLHKSVHPVHPSTRPSIRPFSHPTIHAAMHLRIRPCIYLSK